jgi:hypothetical protein
MLTEQRLCEKRTRKNMKRKHMRTWRVKYSRLQARVKKTRDEREAHIRAIKSLTAEVKQQKKVTNKIQTFFTRLFRRSK